MNKDKLQQELLAKIKPGMKPSDLKRPKKPIPQSQVKDEGYESDRSDHSIPKAPPLPNQQIQSLQSQITSLKKQLQVYQDFKKADLKIKEKYKETISQLQTENNSLNKTLQELKSPTQNPENSQEPKLFFCDICQLTKQGTYIKRKIDSPFSPRTHKKLCYICSTCSKYTKELNESNFDPENNPYKYE